MRFTSIHVGDLVCIAHIASVIGVVVTDTRMGTFVVHVFRDNCAYTFPRAMVWKIKNKEKE